MSPIRIGSTYQTKSSGMVEVIDYIDCYNITVRFLITGSEKKVRAGNLRNGMVKDLFLPSVCGVGFLGNHKTKAIQSNDIYSTWKSMIYRCYSSTSLKYSPSYHDCRVCDDWHDFSMFEEWYAENHPSDGLPYELDKDIKVKGNRVYSPDYCQFVTKKENSTQALQRPFKIKSPEGVVVSGVNVRKFCRENGLTNSQVIRLLNGKCKCHKGWTLA